MQARGKRWRGSNALTAGVAVVAITVALAGCGGGGGGGGAAPPSSSPPPPTVTLVAAPTSVTAGQDTVLTWSSTNATSCTGSGGWNGARATSGSETIQGLASTTSYALQCAGTTSSASTSITVTVTPAGSSNRSPVLVKAATDQRGVVGHAFSYDLSQGGTAVTDPDGDVLTYTNATVPLILPAGLTVTGPVISGVPTEAGGWRITLLVDDGQGGNTVSMEFILRVVPNSPPVVAIGNRPHLVTANAPLQLDASQNGTTFQDADGDAMSYAVSLRGDPQGLVVAGTQVSGRLNRVGAVEVTVTARDAYGGVGSDSFLIAVAAAESSRAPTLPVTPYVYRDEELPLPDMYRTSSESIIPLWDTQPPDNRTTNAGAALGRVLFYDTRLSITNTVACGTCHEQVRGFATSRRFDSGVLGLPLPRNSMALANARYSIHNAWFGDMRVGGDLRNLIFVPIDRHDEQGMALFAVEAKLKDVAFYPPLFTAAFGTPEITRERIAAALAQFVQSLITYRSKSDVAENPMENVPFTPEAVYSAQEMRGRDLFTPLCGLCHEVHAGANDWQANNGLDVVPSDVGTQNPALQRNGSLGVFRAASLRNVAVSAPYMHDGRFNTLREVIDHYDHGVKDSPNLDAILRDVFGAPVRFNFSEEDKVALEAFLNTMTDEAFLADPKFSDPFPPP